MAPQSRRLLTAVTHPALFAAVLGAVGVVLSLNSDPPGPSPACDSPRHAPACPCRPFSLRTEPGRTEGVSVAYDDPDADEWQ